MKELGKCWETMEEASGIPGVGIGLDSCRGNKGNWGYFPFPAVPAHGSKCFSPLALHFWKKINSELKCHPAPCCHSRCATAHAEEEPEIAAGGCRRWRETREPWPRWSPAWLQRGSTSPPGPGRPSSRPRPHSPCCHPSFGFTEEAPVIQGSILPPPAKAADQSVLESR